MSFAIFCEPSSPRSSDCLVDSHSSCNFAHSTLAWFLTFSFSDCPLHLFSTTRPSDDVHRLHTFCTRLLCVYLLSIILRGTCLFSRFLYGQTGLQPCVTFSPTSNRSCSLTFPALSCHVRHSFLRVGCHVLPCADLLISLIIERHCQSLPSLLPCTRPSLQLINDLQ